MKTKLNVLIAALLVAVLSGCGYESRDNEMIGQVKKVTNQTPMICSDYYAADISMGVMRNGVGSMSREDVWTVIPADQVATFKKLAETGEPVKVTYDVKRLVWCTSTDHFIRTVEIAK